MTTTATDQHLQGVGGRGSNRGGFSCQGIDRVVGPAVVKHRSRGANDQQGEERPGANDVMKAEVPSLGRGRRRPPGELLAQPGPAQDAGPPEYGAGEDETEEHKVGRAE